MKSYGIGVLRSELSWYARAGVHSADAIGSRACKKSLIFVYLGENLFSLGSQALQYVKENDIHSEKARREQGSKKRRK